MPYIKAAYINAIGKNASTKININKQQHLHMHDLFMQKAKYSAMINNSIYSNNVNTKIIHIILNSQVMSVLNICKDIITGIDIIKLDRGEFIDLLYDTVGKFKDEHRFLITQNIANAYDCDVTHRICDYIMNDSELGLTTYYNIHYDYIMLLIQNIKDIKESTIQNEDSNIDLFNIFLNSVNSFLYSSIIQTRWCFQKFNGHLLDIINERDKHQSNS
jgi:hypothetical protein